MNRTCFDCEHMGYTTGDPGWSELTPGWDAEIYCRKSHWQYDAYNDTKDEVRKKIYMALECVDFKAEPQEI